MLQRERLEQAPGQFPSRAAAGGARTKVPCTKVEKISASDVDAWELEEADGASSVLRTLG